MASQARTRSCRMHSSGDTTPTWWRVSSGGGTWASKVPTMAPPFAAMVSTVRPMPKSRGNSSKVVVSGSSASLPWKWTSLPTKRSNPPEKQRIRALYDGGNAAKTSTVNAERVLTPPQQSAVPWVPTLRQPPHFAGPGGNASAPGTLWSITEGEAPTASASKDSAGNACTSSAWRRISSSSSASSTQSAQSSKAPPLADQVPSSCGFSKPSCAQNWTKSWKQ
mmetsp:Transcript_117424/g.374227  ORF Transcript_117424/g.374227 Transcript_117424/m.374227 type:complete len:222 (-) Transcript_117424:191-856(-)